MQRQHGRIGPVFAGIERDRPGGAGEHGPEPSAHARPFARRERAAGDRLVAAVGERLLALRPDHDRAGVAVDTAESRQLPGHESCAAGDLERRARRQLQRRRQCPAIVRQLVALERLAAAVRGDHGQHRDIHRRRGQGQRGEHHW